MNKIIYVLFIYMIGSQSYAMSAGGDSPYARIRERWRNDFMDLAESEEFESPFSRAGQLREFLLERLKASKQFEGIENSRENLLSYWRPYQDKEDFLYNVLFYQLNPWENRDLDLMTTYLRIDRHEAIRKQIRWAISKDPRCVCASLKEWGVSLSCLTKILVTKKL